MWAVPAVSCILLGSPVDTVCTDQLLGVPWAQACREGSVGLLSLVARGRTLEEWPEGRACRCSLGM